ncbi:MAG: sensor histidine kinase [Bryobacteraceae bacterium]
MNRSVRRQLCALAGTAGFRRADAAFRRAIRGRPAPVRRALEALSPASAAALLAEGRPPSVFFEQVRYNARRLAKLGAAAEEIARVLAVFDASPPQFHLATLLEVSAAFYAVREAEAETFYGLFRAEVEAAGLEDLLRRSVAILKHALRARAGALVLGAPPAELRRARYIEAGQPAENLLEARLRGRFASYWSVPMSRGATRGLWQFGFAKPYPWLPRELELLDAAAERCLAAVDRRRLAEDLVRVEEMERRRISRELHDEAGQSLLLLRLELEKLERAAPEELRAELGGARAIAERTVAEIRRVLRALSPAVLERYGLQAGLARLAEELRTSGIERVELDMPRRLRRLPRDLEAVLYRVAQECCHNAARHAGARSVKLCLSASDKWVELTVADNGRGFDLERALAKTDSFGLAGMRERVVLLGGSLEIRSQPGRGAAIRARLPVR